jgi:hypothetical protein
VVLGMDGTRKWVWISCIMLSFGTFGGDFCIAECYFAWKI